jgi:O-antigen ligase
MASSVKATSTLLAQTLAFLIPASLGLYWFIYPSQPALAALLFRPAILAACMTLSLLLWYRVPITRAEKDLAGVLGFVCLVLLVCSLASVDPGRALHEWVKLPIICMVSVVLCRALRHPPTAKVFGVSLIVVSLAIAALMVATYIHSVGPVVPTYRMARIFKGTLENVGIPLNSIAFECVFAYISGMCLLRSSKTLWFLGVVLLVISSVLTGSRAPIAAFGISGLVLGIINTLRSRRLLVWVMGAIVAATIILGATVAITTLNEREMSAFTEGRWYLWSVALHKFADRPLVGHGYLSVTDDPTYIPGGYHNEYVTALAEQGIAGAAAVLGLFWFLLRRSWNLAFRRSYTWHNGQWALFGCLFLSIRAAVELPGLFGNAQEPVDFLAYVFLALVVSRFSLEEDYIRSAAAAAIAPVGAYRDRLRRRAVAFAAKPRSWEEAIYNADNVSLDDPA